MKSAKISSDVNCDYISGLTDPILHHILGLLKTKEAVQTCVLTKRWEHLWTSLTSLNFNFIDFGIDSNDVVSEESILMSAVRFVRFVNALLLGRKPLDLDEFHLIFYEHSAVRDWNRYAVNHNTRVLHLTSCRFMPHSIYTCKSLEELYLYSPNIDSSAQKANLPNLKKLSISNADLNSNYVTNFLSGSPKLEIILVDTCKFTDCVISHEHLKYLFLVKCHIEELFASAPNLFSFGYYGELSLPYKTTLNMPSLASSCLVSCDSSLIKCLEGMATCLRYLTNVELLDLIFDCRRYEELLASVLSLELPIFSNLKDVTVQFCMFSYFQIVTWILKSSPKLKALTILQTECVSHGEKEGVSSTIAISLSKNLEIVEVKYWKYNQMIRQLHDTLMDAKKEFENLKIHWSIYNVIKTYYNT